jgi:hypothetical protein
MPDLPEWDEAYGATLLAEFKGLAAAQAAQAENMRARARQAFGLVIAFFAVAQTAALSSFNASHFSRHSQHLVLGWAVTAAVLGAVTGVFVLLAHVTKSYPVVGQADVEAAADRAIDLDDDIAVILAKRYQQQVKNGETILKARKRLLNACQLFSVLALVATTIEIITALSARL